MADKLVRIETVDEGIVRLTMDDAQNRNRLSEGLCRELMEAFASLADRPELRVLMLAGRDDVFCAGATLETLDRLSSGEVDVRDLLLPAQMLKFPLPIVAELRGHAVGGGLALSLCCDVVVACESSRYSVNFTSLGFTPGMGTMSLLPAVVGTHFASEMILTAKNYKGRELVGRGLFNHIVPGEDVAPLALDLARRIADKPRHVLEMARDTLAIPRRLMLEQATAREHLMHRICFGHPEVASRVRDNYLD